MEILFVRVFSLYQWSVSADIREVEEANCTEIVLRRRATTSLLPRFIFMTARCVFFAEIWTSGLRTLEIRKCSPLRIQAVSYVNLYFSLKSGSVAVVHWKSKNFLLSGTTRFITQVLLQIGAFR